MSSFGGSNVSSRVGSRVGSKQSLGDFGSSRAPSKATPRNLPPVAKNGKGRLLLKDGDVDAVCEPLAEAGAPAYHLSCAVSAIGEERENVKASALGAGWSKKTYSGYEIQPPHALEVAKAEQFTNHAMTQLNQMYAYMERAMTRERARHSSDLHMLMRKVDRDLKDTFGTVRETFMSLTLQVQELLREVDAGKKSIARIKKQFDAATTSAAIRAQYVEELEAVLDGQVPNISEAMRKLSEEVTSAKIHVEKVNLEAAEKDRVMAAERVEMRAAVRALEERLNEKEVMGFAGATELPLLPEMAATWTIRQSRPQTTDGAPSDGAPSDDGAVVPGPDVLGTTMARSDATRAVTRMKCVKPQGARPATTPAAPARGSKFCRRLTHGEQAQVEQKIAATKQRAQAAEERVRKQHRIFLEAAPSLQLLREIFSELRTNWRLKFEEAQGDFKDIETLRAEAAMTAKAPDLLDKIVQLFVEAFPQLGQFSNVLEALCEEATKRCPRLSCVVDNLRLDAAEGDSSDGGLSAASDGQLSPVADHSSASGDDSRPYE